MIAIEQLWNKLYIVEVMQGVDTRDEKLQKAAGFVRENLNRIYGNLIFFDLQIARLGAKPYEAQLKKSAFLRKYRTMLDTIRYSRSDYLPEAIEKVLNRTSVFITTEWVEHLEEVLADSLLMIRLARGSHRSRRRRKGSVDVPSLLATSSDPSERREALTAFNSNLGANVAKPMARAINVVVGSSLDECEQRGIIDPLESVAEENGLDLPTVEALHESVSTTGARVFSRLYKLIGANLGKRPLHWSDQDSLLVPESGKVGWRKALEIVHTAYAEFDPSLVEPLELALSRGWIDAPFRPGKASHHYVIALPMPKGLGIRVYTQLRFGGAYRDVFYLAHEVGHLIQGIRTPRRYGVIQPQPTVVAAESTAILGEMIVFEYLLRNAQSDHERLKLLGIKMREFLFNVARTIAYSTFERHVHRARAKSKLTISELSALWRASLESIYGPAGEVFNYNDTEFLWAREMLLLEPFYLFGYAYAELFVQGMFLSRANMPEARFKKRCLEFINRCTIMDADEQAERFRFRLETKADFDRVLNDSFGKWITEAERLSAKLGVSA